MFLKKTLGQHFLRDPRILRKIADAASLAPTDTVLEVGPGDGPLTKLLLAEAGKVIAVEKDDRLIPVLKQKFATEIAARKLELIHADILSLSTFYSLPSTGYKIVANLPYYITGNFLRKFLQETERQPVSMTLLLQKEVAKRIACLPEPRRRQVAKESLLSISVKAYGEPRYIDTVKAGSFVPPPKVDSAILVIKNISKEFFADAMVKPPYFTRSDLVKRREREFFELLKRGFAHPRKFLSGNLGIPAVVFQRCGIPPRARAENLTLPQWKRLLTVKKNWSR